MSGNQALCEVDKPFIEDSFNLFGLKQFVPNEFTKALTTIVDRQGNILAVYVNLKLPAPNQCAYCADPDEEESTEVAQSACLLYGLIHARFIITTNGLQAMVRSSRRSLFIAVLTIALFLNILSTAKEIPRKRVWRVSTDILQRPSGAAGNPSLCSAPCSLFPNHTVRCLNLFGV
jgi:hypothetical protein